MIDETYQKDWVGSNGCYECFMKVKNGNLEDKIRNGRPQEFASDSLQDLWIIIQCWIDIYIFLKVIGTRLSVFNVGID